MTLLAILLCWVFNFAVAYWIFQEMRRKKTRVQLVKLELLVDVLGVLASSAVVASEGLKGWGLLYLFIGTSFLLMIPSDNRKLDRALLAEKQERAAI